MQKKEAAHRNRFKKINSNNNYNGIVNKIMETKILQKLQIVRTALMSEITNSSFKLKNIDLQSELAGTIPLKFCNDVYQFCPSLENYPFLKINSIEPTLVYVDKNYKEEYINAYKTGELTMSEDSLDMFSTDELYNICEYLTGLEEENITN